MIWTVTYTNLTYYMIKKNINLLSNTVNQSEQNEKKVYISETSMLSNLRFPETILDLNTNCKIYMSLSIFFFNENCLSISFWRSKKFDIYIWTIIEACM